MKVKKFFKNIILIIFVVLFMISLLSSLFSMFLFIEGLIYNIPDSEIFEVKNEKYILKVIGKPSFIDPYGTYETNIFSYERVKDREYFRIGCGSLYLAGYDDKKHYFYGQSIYENEEVPYKGIGYGAYTNGKTEYIGNKIVKNEDKENKKLRMEYLKKQCTGYFILNLETGEYQTGLSKEEQEKILQEKGIENNIEKIDKFLFRYGKNKEYNKMEEWMQIGINY